eukprot:CAMPEP_0201550728 /NCGR_PEP_ID=MMETSP0173_2-20130828/7043_1 /ASSEMBLY_ACC=CAM_ASM_000268 /TAXON_ID=218659 /ORGANISM="Vexillifera sp., Strain DIVA3 564/2" /LENGTH=172 /DNA_ID=CAMNT_0047960789 /DNA_START=72 /DNA_END=590 /DNA_ORIENTATION=+
MSITRDFVADDLFRFNNVNLDLLTETYNLGFYLEYMSSWPDYQAILTHPNGKQMGYVMGKVEGEGENWHGHVTAVTVAPPFRRIGLATRLMDFLEGVSQDLFDSYFVDLFVRVSNDVAVSMYKKMGYSIYRQVIGYYSGEEDAYDMRKALARDVDKRSIIPLPHPVYPSDLD